MWRTNLITVMMLLLSFISFAQTSEDMDRILKLTGYDSPEEMDGYEVERLESYIEHPLKINMVSAAVIRSCGLFSPYQAASLLDYRSRHGDVMSFAELSAVDGFTGQIVAALAPFIALEGGDAVRTSGGNADADIAARGGLKAAGDDLTGGYGLKCRFNSGNGISMALSASATYDRTLRLPDICSGSLKWEPVRRPFRVIAGDFNARFGQGLALWNGMSMTGLSKASSYFRSAAGISSSWSYTGSSAHTGAACELSFSRLRLSAFVSFPEVKKKGFRRQSFLPAVNLAWYGRNMSMSMTHYMELSPATELLPGYIPDMKTAADIAVCLNGTDMFSEVAFDWVNMVPAVLFGMISPVGEDMRLAVHLRYYPGSFNPSRSAAPRSVSKCANEYGASLCCEYSPRSGPLSGSLSFDSAYLPVSKEDARESIHVRIMADGELRLSDAWRLKFRISERIRTWGQPFKTDVRTDMLWSSQGFTVSGRINVLNYVSTGFLGYLEGGYKVENIAVYVRQLGFSVDNWDDRIYAYERDAPGSFSVPAFYGRGMNTSFMFSWRFSGWGRLYFNGSFTYGQKEKPGKAGLKLQCVFSF